MPFRKKHPTIHYFLKTGLAFLLFICIRLNATAQFIVSGTVYDSSRLNYVEQVRVVSTGGMFAITDSLGKYRIRVNEQDSLVFYYNGKPTTKFAVKSIQNPEDFNISLHIRVNSKYRVMKEVIIFSKSYREDSSDNRDTYTEAFNYSKPRIATSVSPSGGVGMDVNELINMFRFKRNKRLKAFKQRLEEQEENKYVDYRFNKLFVRRVTGLEGAQLDSFMVWYRPPYSFTRDSSELEFNQYILNAWYHFQKLYNTAPAKKPE